MLGRNVRIGRPLGVAGLPEAAKGPAFSAAVGLLIYPQVAEFREHPAGAGFMPRMTGTGGTSAHESVVQGQFLESKRAYGGGHRRPQRRGGRKGKGQKHDDQSQKPDITELKPRITVFGVGGGGGNAVNNMITAGPAGRRVRRRQHRRQALTSSKAERMIQLGVACHRRSRRRLAARGRPRRRRGSASTRSSTICRLAHVLRHRRHGRRHRHRRRAGRRPRRARQGHPDRRRRHQAVPFRGRAPHASRRARHRGAAEMRRHADRHPEPESVPDRQREDDLRRCFRDGRPGALFRRRLHHRPDGQGRPDQSRLRRRPLGDARDGQGDDGHRRGLRRRPRDAGRRGGDRQSAARRDLDEGRHAAC